MQPIVSDLALLSKHGIYVEALDQSIYATLSCVCADNLAGINIFNYIYHKCNNTYMLINIKISNNFKLTQSVGFPKALGLRCRAFVDFVWQLLQ